MNPVTFISPRSFVPAAWPLALAALIVDQSQERRRKKRVVLRCCCAMLASAGWRNLRSIDERHEVTKGSALSLESLLMQNWHCQKFHAAASDRVSKTHNKTRNKKIIKSTMASRVHHFKLVLLGDTAVGKSCLVVRFVRDEFFEFQEPTIGGKKNRKGRHYVPVQKGATAGLTRPVSSRGKLRKFYVRSRPRHKREKNFPSVERTLPFLVVYLFHSAGFALDGLRQFGIIEGGVLVSVPFALSANEDSFFFASSLFHKYCPFMAQLRSLHKPSSLMNLLSNLKFGYVPLG